MRGSWGSPEQSSPNTRRAILAIDAFVVRHFDLDDFASNHDVLEQSSPELNLCKFRHQRPQSVR